MAPASLLLIQQGYATTFFQSSTEHFENFRGLVTNFGYEDDIMLGYGVLYEKFDGPHEVPTEVAREALSWLMR